MSAAEATRFVQHVESDEALAERLTALSNDPADVHALVLAEGFDCTPDEIKDAFLEAHGDKLTAEQLEAIAGGINVAGTEVHPGSAAMIGMVAVGVGVAASAAF